MLGVHRVFVDANVLYSQTLRDWLALIYLQGEQPPYSVFWSEDVLAEMAYHLRRQHPDWEGGRIAAIREKVTATFEVGRVRDYEVLDDGATTDPGDRHVHAAALACGADILLTCNVKDFVTDQAYDVMHPDEFFVLVDDSVPWAVRAATQQNLDYWSRRRHEVDLPGRLQLAGCSDFAARVLAHVRALALQG